MLILLSPAKTLDFETPPTTQLSSLPRFLEHSAQLVDVLKPYSPEEVGALMKISPALAQLNAERFYTWQLPFPAEQAKAAVLAFKGDVYVGLQADTLSEQQLEFAQQYVRILSGLYGVLKPLDVILPYRLEMGTKLVNPKGKDLYQFWGETLTQSLNQELNDQASDIVINLASNEYFKAIQPKKLQANLITPVFKDEKNGQYKIISFYAKKARGLMARWLIEQGLNIKHMADVEQLKRFDVAGYRFSAEESNSNEFVFKRSEKDSFHA